MTVHARHSLARGGRTRLDGVLGHAGPACGVKSHRQLLLGHMTPLNWYALNAASIIGRRKFLQLLQLSSLAAVRQTGMALTRAQRVTTSPFGGGVVARHGEGIGRSRRTRRRPDL